MHIIVGGTGQVGSAVARALLKRGEPVTVVTRDAEHAADLAAAGAKVAVVNIRDVAALRATFRTGTRAFLLNPPADPSGDTDVEERANVAAIITALDGSDLEKVVAASTYGARAGERCGDLTVLHELEEKLRAQPIPAAINRGAYYMSNWAGMLGPALESGKLPSFFPADLALPMVAPTDLGEAAADRLVSPADDTV
ncbi:NmrA family NAD(P)-binding protein [Actibacterium sp. D379-3]